MLIILIISFISSVFLFRARLVRELNLTPSQILFFRARKAHESFASKIYRAGVRCNPNKIEIYRDKSEVKEIEKLYKEAIELEDRAKNRSNVAIGYLQLGYYYRTLEYLDTAENYLHKSLKMIDDLIYENPYDESILSELAVALFRLGELNHVRGKYEEAKKKYAESLQIDQKLGNKKGIRTVSMLMKQIDEKT
ncbi:hypothetical protein DRN85_00875 [Methanosarcinales archaeon]|nr:MAG: hypothetical protein DRN85_00875 [Methanosarcinales archaeon]